MSPLQDKELELVREVERFQVGIVGLTSTHSKGSGTSLQARGRTLFNSGAADNERRWARAAIVQTCWWTPAVRDAKEAVGSGLRGLWDSWGSRQVLAGLAECSYGGRQAKVEEFKYLGNLFTSEVRIERVVDRRIGALWCLQWPLKGHESIYRSIFVPTLTYGHEIGLVTERRRSQVQAAKISFLRRMVGLSELRVDTLRGVRWGSSGF